MSINFRSIIAFIGLIMLFGWFIYNLKTNPNFLSFSPKTMTTASPPNLEASPEASPSPSPSPSPKPLTFAEMNALYGPCVYVPTLTYHHIEDLETAKAENHSSLAVAPDIFRQQMDYLRQQGYSTAKMQDLLNFFDQGIPMPAKPVLLTFDDGYQDFADNAFPILQEFGFSATVFLPTGLVENPGYLSWSTAQSISQSGLVLFANHTLSHHSAYTDETTFTKEVTLADQQLTEHGISNVKVFAYPYGSGNNQAGNILVQNGYTLAFTTNYGGTLCKQQRLFLPRIRIGNAPLNQYGL